MAFLLPQRFVGSQVSQVSEPAPSTPRKGKEEDLTNCDLSRLLMMASPLRAGLGRSSTAAASPSKEPQSPSRSTAPSLANIATPTRVRQSPSPAVKEKARLPPVVSVYRMPARGCAIVTLRDKAVLELSVAMRVAVVDGVCVEVRRHVRKAKEADDGEATEGVFVAWGHRVARRVDVSEEGIEAYFNGLSAVSEPEGLDFKRPFEEQLQLFELSSEGPLQMDTLPTVDTALAARMLEGPHGRADLVRNLWEAKEQLDEMWNKPPPPMGRSLMQRVARDQLFPHSGKEGEKHENRAGEKLEELAMAVGLLDGVPAGSAFLDLCGGPGAWSQFLLSKPELAMRGFGFTLRSGSGDAKDWQAEEKDDWYSDLLENPKWTALWGSDGTGDLLKPQNLEHSTAQLRKQGGVFLCVADGGFSDKAIPANLLELYFYRLFLAELLTAASCLVQGGRFVCKLYTSCSTATSSLLFLTTRLFDYVAIVKPMTSRVAGPERYLYASGFRPGAETEEVRAALTRSQELGGGAGPLQVPLLSPVVAATELAKDEGFSQQLSAMVAGLCERQAGSLFAIVERAEELEEIALDAAEEAREGSRRWAIVAAAQREAAAAAAAEAAMNSPWQEHRHSDRHSDRRGERLSGFGGYSTHSGYGSKGRGKGGKGGKGGSKGGDRSRQGGGRSWNGFQ
ncbi:unnamed protein product [Polarella glacialis]|uniref:Cap-specific mRNA (nucleoside-2'-O-)-methyltransferase 1 n=1 Tax=Polarella glacialis TaxID=89957 RepID=A0A813GMA1_POLGL|nr:unnamed protein product [Polarella glacialis]